MERLTEMYGGMIVPRKACTFDREGGADDCKECTEICEDEGGVCRTCILQECLTRLWDYEGTGLTPPEIMEMEKIRMHGSAQIAKRYTMSTMIMISVQTAGR